MRRTIERLEARQFLSAVVGTSTITLFGTPGNDSFTYDMVDYGSNTGRVNNWTINDSHGQEITPFIYHINIYGMGGNDNIKLSNLKSGVKVNVYTGSGDDAVSVVENQASVTLHDNGGIRDSVYYWASWSLGESETHVEGKAIAPWVGASRGVHFAPGSVETLDVDGTGKNSLLYVDEVLSGTAVNIDGREGTDTVVVGSGDIDSNIKGKLFIKDSGNHGFGTENNTIILDDSQDAGGDIDILNAHTFTKSSMTVAPFFSGFQHVRLKESGGDDLIRITAADAKDIKVTAGKGNDQFELGYGNLDAFAYTLLSLDGGEGNDLVVAKDNAVYSYETYKLSPGKFERSGMNPIADANVEVFNVFASNAPSGDFIDASAATQKVIVNAGTGSDLILGGMYDDILRGGAGNDTIYANAGADWVEGNNGADLIRGGAGDDVLDGGAGKDKVSGESGNDTLWILDGEKDQYYGGVGTNTYHKDDIDFKQIVN